MTKKNKPNRYYIAYGSNLNVAQMARRCPDAEVFATSIIKDYRLLFKGSKTGAYLTIEPAEGYEVPIGIWKVSAEDELRLDRYEGYPDFYYKTYVRFVGDDDSELNAFIYIMHEERSIAIPGSYYIQTCTQGYEDFGFDPKYLAEALDYSRKVVR